MSDFHCYIDEAGDEGIGTGGTRWFVLGALVVPSEDDLALSEVVPTIKKRLGKDPAGYDLHWRYVDDHRTKKFISQSIGSKPVTFSCIVVDKEDKRIRQSRGLKQKYALYFYSTRYLIERLSWLARDSGRVAHLTFEYRSNLDYDELREYWRYLRILVTEIHWPAVDWRNFKIHPRGLSRWLQASDACCGAVFAALEPDRFGNIEDSYVLALKNIFYRRGSNVFSYGLKFMPTAARRGAAETYSWLEEI